MNEKLASSDVQKERLKGRSLLSSGKPMEQCFFS